MISAEQLEAGALLYRQIATESGFPPKVNPFANIASMLSADFEDVDDFLARLADGDLIAIIEARSHFGLPPFG
jgi:hypothetical protein